MSAMKKRILVVDDEPDFTYSIRMGLETLGAYQVREENDATNARRTAREFMPHLILLDIMMPELDGSEVASAIRDDSRLRHIPVVFCTALVSKKEVRHGSCTSGGNIFLPKPFDLDKLIECIEELTVNVRPDPTPEEKLVPAP